MIEEQQAAIRGWKEALAKRDVDKALLDVRIEELTAEVEWLKTLTIGVKRDRPVRLPSHESLIPKGDTP